MRWGVFHSISAFCNAGFDIFGELEPGTSLLLFQDDPVVLLTLGLLIVVGGLGFLVWEDLGTKRSFRKGRFAPVTAKNRKRNPGKRRKRRAYCTASRCFSSCL